MTGEKGPYRVGQKVEVRYWARVAEVFTGPDDDEAVALRLEGLTASYDHPPGGWVSPLAVNVTVVADNPETEDVQA